MSPEPITPSAREPASTTRPPSRLRLPLQIAATYVIGLVIPFLVYWGLDSIGFDITGVLYVVVCTALVVTAAMIVAESIAALKREDPPPPRTSYPPASAIICAYLPNEAGTILDTVDSFLANGYPGGLQIILAYNTPHRLPVEDHLQQLAQLHPELHVVRVEGSNSKAQNVNAALHLATGEFTAMFDADHEPRPGSFQRAWGWLSNGYDVVQGHCLTRNGSASWLASVVAVEFESIYAVSHPGRARLHGFGIFGGSNGYWRTELLHQTRMRGSMLTEDIDSSLRVVELGHRIRSDRSIVSRELGTTTMRQLWNQRLRWAQGWFQVTLQHSRRVWQSRHLSLRQKLGMSYLLGWREVYPWLSLQVFPLIAYWLFRGDDFEIFQPVFFLGTIFVLHVGPAQTLFAYLLGDREITRHRWWFIRHLVASTFFYTELKNIVSRVAQLKELMGERSWRVTPRSQDPVGLEPLDQT
jgi:cellulose synthase/poly-beta-1,6-N-acetylglucosamine synthase-like glycosyltransferase